PTTSWGGRNLSPIMSITSGITQCACTSMVLTRRPLTTTSRRFTGACAWASGAGRRPHPQNTAPANAPPPPMKSLRVVMLFPCCGSLDHLISAGQQVGRNAQAKRLRSLEIDDELEFGRGLNRHVGRFFA